MRSEARHQRSGRPEGASGASRPRGGAGGQLQSALRAGGEVLITLGVVLLLFVGYEVYVTDLLSAAKQRDATAALEDR